MRPALWTKRTKRTDLLMSVASGRPEVLAEGQTGAFDPTEALGPATFMDAAPRSLLVLSK
jgi:hypothetical protein